MVEADPAANDEQAAAPQYSNDIILFASVSPDVKRTALTYNKATGEVGATEEDERVDFSDCFSVQADNEIHSFKNGNFHKYTYDNQLKLQEVSQNANPADSCVSKVGLTYFAGNIILTGGEEGDPVTQIYDVKENSWSDGPDMNVERAGHCQCKVGDYLYVFGGQNEDGLVGSMEKLNITAQLGGQQQQWQTVDVSSSSLSARLYPIVVAISATEILIMGGIIGFDEGMRMANDCYILDTTTDTVTK